MLVCPHRKCSARCQAFLQQRKANYEDLHQKIVDQFNEPSKEAGENAFDEIFYFYFKFII